MGDASGFESTALDGVLLISPRIHTDERGWFSETYSAADFGRAVGVPIPFVQDNESESSKGTLRGIHYQAMPTAQGKLVRVVAGAVFDVAVDLRKSSKTLGQWIGTMLTADNHRQIWIPAGFGHGFLAMEDQTRVAYKTTAPYAPACARTIRWDDPDLAIAWPIADGEPTVSINDAGAPGFAGCELFD